MSVVMKFGGTSVADPTAIGRVVEIVGRQAASEARGGLPVVVVSAFAGVTDRLIDAGRAAERGEIERAVSLLHDLLERHRGVALAMTSGSKATALVADLERDTAAALEQLRTWATVSGSRALDAVAAAGELMSSRIVTAALAEAGVSSAWVDARLVVVTDGEHTAAAPDMPETVRSARALLCPLLERRTIGVMGGFIGATRDGITTTLGRGGSDYSAAIVGAALDVEEIQIWTDVDGMLTADPRIVDAPRLVAELSFAEASELAYFGAKVLHPSTLLPAMAGNIPVRILNSRRPDVEGTWITAVPRRPPGGGLTALACKRGVTVVDITSTRMLMAHGFLRRLFEVFERFKTPVDVVTTSEVSVSVTVDDTRRLDGVVQELRHVAEIACEPSMAIVCAVGESIRTDPTIFLQAVTALGEIPLRLVSQAASRRNVTFVLRDADAPRAMALLHEEFFERERTASRGALASHR